MINETIFAMIVVASGGIAASLEVFKKTYLPKVLGEFSWYENYKVWIIRGCAFFIAAIAVLSSNDLSLFQMVDWQPVGNVGLLTDFFVTSLVLSLGEEFIHNGADVIRLIVAVKSANLRYSAALVKSQTKDA